MRTLKTALIVIAMLMAVIATSRIDGSVLKAESDARETVNFVIDASETHYK